jgi:hypothetical protein
MRMEAMMHRTFVALVAAMAFAAPAAAQKGYVFDGAAVDTAASGRNVVVDAESNESGWMSVRFTGGVGWEPDPIRSPGRNQFVFQYRGVPQTTRDGTHFVLEYRFGRSYVGASGARPYRHEWHLSVGRIANCFPKQPDGALSESRDLNLPADADHVEGAVEYQCNGMFGAPEAEGTLTPSARPWGSFTVRLRFKLQSDVYDPGRDVAGNPLSGGAAVGSDGTWPPPLTVSAGGGGPESTSYPSGAYGAPGVYTPPGSYTPYAPPPQGGWAPAPGAYAPPPGAYAPPAAGPPGAPPPAVAGAGQPPPPPPPGSRARHPHWGLFGGGLALFLGSYFANVGVTYGLGHEPQWKSLVPVGGPAMALTDDFSVENRYGARTLLVFDLLGQAAGVVTALVGLAWWTDAPAAAPPPPPPPAPAAPATPGR